jgi:hypothetical protein
MEFVRWDDDMPNIWKIKNVPDHQPDMYIPMIFLWYSYDIPIYPNDISILSHLVTIKMSIKITKTFH